MIINHTYKFVFIHIPKAAGTSLTNALSPLTKYRDQEIGGTHLGQKVGEYYAKRYGLRKHSTAVDIRHVMTAAEWSGYLKFAIVRNPFDRLLSAYHFLKGWEGLPKHHREKIDLYKSAQHFLDSGVWAEWAGPDNIFKPQSTWICDNKSNEIIVDFLGKTEDLTTDLHEIVKRLKVTREVGDLRTLNKSQKASGQVTWTDDVLGLFRQRYGDDIELFGYANNPHQT